MADMIFTKFHLHPTVLIPESAPTPRYATRAPSLSSETSDPPSPIAHIDSIDIDVEIAHNRHERTKNFLRPLIRVILAVSSILGGLLIPSFESLLSFLGGGLGIVSVIIIPVWAGAEAFGWRKLEYVVIAVSAVFAVIGTVCSFWPDSSAS
jgi:vesicular inhibitory amino acid transporter